jgi:hypothetical protein
VNALGEKTAIVALVETRAGLGHGSLGGCEESETFTPSERIAVHSDKDRLEGACQPGHLD